VGSKSGRDFALTKDFIIRSIRHHIVNSQQIDVLLWEDELLMCVLTHNWYAATTLTPTKAGEELKWAAISNLPNETDKSRSLKSKVISLLMVVQEDACECIYIFTSLLVSIVWAHLSVS